MESQKLLSRADEEFSWSGQGLGVEEKSEGSQVEYQVTGNELESMTKPDWAHAATGVGQAAANQCPQMTFSRSLRKAFHSASGGSVQRMLQG